MQVFGSTESTEEILFLQSRIGIWNQEIWALFLGGSPYDYFLDGKMGTIIVYTHHIRVKLDTPKKFVKQFLLTQFIFFHSLFHIYGGDHTYYWISWK